MESGVVVNDEYKEFILKLGFTPKENASNMFQKKYANSGNYCIEVDFAKEFINYGSKIKTESKTTQNFSQPENLVVLECINRLLEKGYKPEDITLEKTFPSGHGHSGRLDIFIENHGKAFLMIECKTSGKEFDKEHRNIHKNGGQLFTYFQNNTNAQYLMLYASEFINNSVNYKCEIIKIEEHYRNAGNVEDAHDRWNKITNQNGIFESWVDAYKFENKSLTKGELVHLKESDSSLIFHEFLSILRKHSVSDKPNAFNKIFNLFLSKIFDEKKRDNDELDFQWKEKSDDDVSFQIRLINLYQQGMFEFLKKEVEGISDDDFNYKSIEELHEKKKKWLKFNNVFAIKEVVDNESFDDNARVLKEVVGLLHKYKIRYPRKQKNLSDFFERLLTTGLKQESGQFFSPPPITKFIIRSIPVKETIIKELDNPTPTLPAVIDFAVGSGHFITEIMEEYQNIIDKLDTENFFPEVKTQVEVWQHKKYGWAAKYIYGIEKDYRLVKVAKVGCYFYGDGLAQIIHGDGLDSFKDSKSYVGLLKTKTDDADNAKFSFVVSNPPYSVKTFKGDLKNKNAAKDFKLYNNLTDRSSEIECLFIERTKQLLKTGGIAGIILPRSILSNTGLYIKAREIILQYFEIIAITEFGSNTFMATGTNTVVLFLRRRKNKDCLLWKDIVNEIFVDFQDRTINGEENLVAKYVKHTWSSIAFIDYQTLLQKQPNETIQQHEIFTDYKKKIKVRNESEFWIKVLAIENEKLYYFVLTCKQKIVLVNTREKKLEKKFLGYEFSNRKGKQGMHPIQRDKSIDECTQLFDPDVFDNPGKASTYIYKAFKGDFDFPIHKGFQNNISRTNLIDMLTFDRVDFEKSISLSGKKKVKIESKWDIVDIHKAGINIIDGDRGKNYPKKSEFTDTGYCVFLNANNIFKNKFQFSTINFIDKERDELLNSGKLERGDVVLMTRGTIGKVAYYHNQIKFEHIRINSGMLIFRPFEKIHGKYLCILLSTKIVQEQFKNLITGSAVPQLPIKDLKNIKIPLPPKEIQQKIVSEIELIERIEKTATEKIENFKSNFDDFVNESSNSKETKLKDIALFLKRGKSTKYGTSNVQIIKSGQARGYKRFDFSEKHYVDKNFVLDERRLETGDILINSSGVGTAGRVTMFTLNGDFVVDSHITILRPDKQKAYPTFILYSLVNIGFTTLESMATGQSGQIELSLPIIKNIKIPLLSLEEQRQLITKIERIEQEIEKLENEIKTIPQQKENIMKKYLE